MLQNDLGIAICSRTESGSKHLYLVLCLAPCVAQLLNIGRDTQFEGKGRAVKWLSARQEVIYDTFLKGRAWGNLLNITLNNTDILDDGMEVSVGEGLDTLLRILVEAVLGRW